MISRPRASPSSAFMGRPAKPLPSEVTDFGELIDPPAPPPKAEPWTLAEAVELCRQIEAICPHYGCHVALTGGTLYKDGPRKDLDVLFYRIRQIERIDDDGLFGALEGIGIVKVSGFGWCHKAVYRDKRMDIFFPEETGGEYQWEDPPSLARAPSLKDAEEEILF